jgi:hypothetical protein
MEIFKRFKKDRIVITTGKDKEMGYKRYCAAGAADALNMLAYAVARELQYMCRNTSQMKDAVREFEKGTLRIACELYNAREKIRVPKDPSEEAGHDPD